jgi:type I site-specific restriction-modification system R (restriction) subunit
MNTTATVFGHELHRYSIADGIRDKNVLGFDPYLISTYKDSKLREAVALDEAKANTIKEALDDPKRKKSTYVLWIKVRLLWQVIGTKPITISKGLKITCQQSSIVVQRIRRKWLKIF